MNGTVDSLAPKRVRKAESPEVSDNQAAATAAQEFHTNWVDSPGVLISK